MVDTAATIWRDYVTEGVPGSGVHKPAKAAIREWGASVEGSKTVSTIAEVKALNTTLTGYARLLDAYRDANFFWDPTVLVADHEADTDEVVFIAPDAEEDGAWVHSTADPRLGAWANSSVPARYGRFRSGVKMGDAAGAYGATGSTDTWLAEIGGNPSTWAWMEQAQVIALRSTGQIAATFGTRLSGSTLTGMGFVAVNYHDGNAGGNGYGGYVEAVAGPNHTTGSSVGLEIQVANLTEGAADPILPYGTNTFGVWGLNIGFGADVNVHDESSNVSAGIRFGGNGSEALVGIVAKTNAFVREDGTATGYARFAALAQGHGVSWYGSTAGAEVLRMYCSIAATAGAQQMSYADDGARFIRGIGGGASTSLFIPIVASSVNGISMRASATGSPVEVAAIGADTNIDLRLEPKGSGLVDFGYAANAAAVTATHRGIVRFNGVAYYIPLQPV